MDEDGDLARIKLSDVLYVPETRNYEGDLEERIGPLRRRKTRLEKFLVTSYIFMFLSIAAASLLDLASYSTGLPLQQEQLLLLYQG